MIKPGENFKVPDDMRALLDQGVTQAREGFDKVMSAAKEAVAEIESKTGAAQSQANELRKKSQAFTEASMTAAFDLAHKLVSAKSIDEVMKLQTEYMTRQLASVRGHVQEAGEEIQRQTKAAAEQLAAETAKLQAKAKEAVEAGVEAVKSAAKPKK